MKKFIITIVCLIFAYYLALLLHEWGHGTVAYLFGYKESPFAVEYGGWLMLHTDENVPYRMILEQGRGGAAALIGIAGISVSIILFLLALLGVKKIRHSEWAYSFCYWLAVINMIPIFHYLTIQTFSVQGDVGRFTHGLQISPWWVFIPGTIFNCFAIYQLLRHCTPKAYGVLKIHSLGAKRIFLLLALIIIFYSSIRMAIIP